MPKTPAAPTAPAAATLAFDVYGTLIDTQGVAAALRRMVGDKAEDIARAWRDKQLEYAFRRGLMGRYANFAVCTAEALEFICAARALPLSAAQKRELNDSYRVLPAFPDVPDCLARLQGAGFRLYAFSNGDAKTVSDLLSATGVRDFFLDVVSVDPLRTFKPDPAAYAHFLRSAGARGDSSWLISGNSFDVIGAMSAGMHAVWAPRAPSATFDPWGAPTIAVANLGELPAALARAAGVGAGKGGEKTGAT